MLVGLQGVCDAVNRGPLTDFVCVGSNTIGDFLGSGWGTPEYQQPSRVLTPPPVQPAPDLALSNPTSPHLMDATEDAFLDAWEGWIPRAIGDPANPSNGKKNSGSDEELLFKLGLILIGVGWVAFQVFPPPSRRRR